MTVTHPLTPVISAAGAKTAASGRFSISRLLLTAVLFSTLLISCGPNDEKVTENVKSSVSILDPSIQVSVKDGVVTLSGQVADESTKNAAEGSIKEVKGVKSVVNNITVKQAETPPVMINYDEAIRSSIDSSFSKKGIVGVIVNVANGEVTLTGNIKRAELTKVMQAANESKPKKVYNKLTIK
jgi:hypothetical protein